MTTISRPFGAVLALCLSLAAGAGCELIAAVDREGIQGAGGGGGNQGSGGGNQGSGGGNQGGGNGSDCDNDIKDGAETDVDCGGGQCPACATGLTCVNGSDCASGKCTSNVCVDVLLISEVRSRGPNGADDEFVELYNPTSVEVTTDSSWKLVARSAAGSASCGSNANLTVWTGAGEVIPSHSHLLIKGSAYAQQPAADATAALAVPDAASLRLDHETNHVDAVCFYFDATSQNNLTTCTTPYAYVCEGAPVLNPHDNTAASNSDKSLERKPGSTGGNATDTNDSSADFTAIEPTIPQNLESPVTP